MQKVNIKNIIYFGRWNKVQDGEFQNWFCLLDYQMYPFIYLHNLYGYKNKEELVSKGIFIPYQKIDTIDLKRQYVAEISLFNSANELSDSQFDEKFDKYLNDNQCHKGWRIYEYGKLYENAIIWCRNNNIAYITD